MGLNLVIGCHRCRQRVWMFRGKEIPPITDFYRAHWQHSEQIELTDDQSLRDWQHEYEDVSRRYGVSYPK